MEIPSPNYVEAMKLEVDKLADGQQTLDSFLDNINTLTTEHRPELITPTARNRLLGRSAMGHMPSALEILQSTPRLSDFCDLEETERLREEEKAFREQARTPLSGEKRRQVSRRRFR